MRVVASLFTPHALTYRLHKGVPFEDTAMAVACLVMVRSESSGVL
jgi:pyruvate,water dikinase